MKMKLFLAAVFSSLMVVLSGCVETADGHMTGGVPLTKDKIINRYERTVPQLVAASREVLGRNGKLLEDNSIGNSLHAKVNERDVYVKVEQVDAKVSQVTVQARGAMGGDIELASQMQTQIALQLATSQ